MVFEYLNRDLADLANKNKRLLGRNTDGCRIHFMPAPK